MSIVFVYQQLKIKIVLFQTIQFSISTRFSSIWPIKRIQSGATTPVQSKPGSDGIEGVLRIPQSSRIARTSPSDCLVSYTGHSCGVIPLCRDAVGVFCSSSQLSTFAIGFRSVHLVGYTNTLILQTAQYLKKIVPYVLGPFHVHQQSFINFRTLYFIIIKYYSIHDTIYQPLRSGRIWHKVNF